jgi:hypothetical protein
MLSKMGDRPHASTGRWLILLAIVCALVGAPLYAAQLTVAGRTDTPWYVPAFGTAGFLLAVVALFRRRTAWRAIVFLFVGGLAALQWWFLLSYVREPAYAGPLASGEPFPAFTALRASGTKVTGRDMWSHTAHFRGDKGEVLPDRATVLVFFRGRW